MYFHVCLLSKAGAHKSFQRKISMFLCHFCLHQDCGRSSGGIFFYLSRRDCPGTDYRQIEIQQKLYLRCVSAWSRKWRWICTWSSLAWSFRHIAPKWIQIDWTVGNLIFYVISLGTTFLFYRFWGLYMSYISCMCSGAFSFVAEVAIERGNHILGAGVHDLCWNWPPFLVGV